MDVIQLSKEEIKHIMLVGTHLHSFQGKESPATIPTILKSQGMIQYDPLSPAGRYHDHFLFSRIENYKQGDWEKLVYNQKLIFEYYNPNLCAISIENFPNFWPLMEQRILNPYYQTRIEKLQSKRPGILDEVFNFVKENGITSGKDLSHLGKAHKEFASWKSNQTSSSVLEYLWLMGKLAVVERTSQFQKKYDVLEHFIPKKFLEKSIASVQQLNYQKFLLMHKSFPVINTKKVSFGTNKISFGKTSVVPTIDETCEDFLFAKVESSNKHIIIPKNYQDLLSIEPFDEHMRLIGVLDPLIWDRDLLKLIFNFEYTWEVYKKEKDRIWGYYVFPLLFRGELIGRMEVKSEGEFLKIFNLSIEPNVRPTYEIQLAFKSLLDRLRSLIGSEKILKDKSFKKLKMTK